MKLYYNPLSTFAQKVLMALYEKNIAFERELVNLFDEPSRLAYEKMYPLGKIPMLQLEGDRKIPESGIIIEYLEDTYPHSGTRLIPEGKDEARQVRMVERMADLYINDPIVKLLFAKLGFAQYYDADLEKARKQIRVSYEHFNQRLANQDWLCGQFSMADCALIPPLHYAQMVAPFNEYPRLEMYWNRAQQRPSYQKVRAEFVPIWEGMLAGK
ncbi:MAG: glutathione S-transferase family protein [Betaproteobacteria bacterium]|nr:glutathione S-transferase family protein [Betaproteobacteria bacterium]